MTDDRSTEPRYSNGGRRIPVWDHTHAIYRLRGIDRRRRNAHRFATEHHLAGYIAEIYGQEISFRQWMRYGTPRAGVGLTVAWQYLTRIVLGTEIKRIPTDEAALETQFRDLGPLSSGEKRVLGVFVLVTIGWMTRGVLIEPVLLMVDDAGIAIFGALLLFVVPATVDGEFTFLLDWTAAVTIPWGIILLFGGGLSLAAGVETTGLVKWLETLLFGIDGVDIVMILLVLALLAVFLTEVTSNTALTAMILPVLAALATSLAIHPSS